MAGKVFGIDDPVTGVTAFTLERQRFETVLVLCFGELRAPVDEFLNTSRGVPHHAFYNIRMAESAPAFRESSI